MIEEFKISFKSHIKSGWSILFLILVLIIFVYLMVMKRGDDKIVFIMISVGIFVLFCGPAIIIHFNYYMINKGCTLTYKHTEREIIVNHNKQQYIFNIDDIKHIDRFMSYNLAAKRSGFLPWDEYNHSIIYLNNGKRITITSLLVPNLNLPISVGRINTKQSLFRLAKRYQS